MKVTKIEAMPLKCTWGCLDAPDSADSFLVWILDETPPVEEEAPLLDESGTEEEVHLLIRKSCFLKHTDQWEYSEELYAFRGGKLKLVYSESRTTTGLLEHKAYDPMYATLRRRCRCGFRKGPLVQHQPTDRCG